MKLSLRTLSDELSKRTIRPSHPRIKVLEYLLMHQSHPTVEQIFTALVGENPTLSKSTIYNTLNLFVKAALVRVLTIENNETRYDIIMEKHGHFKCESCGIIFNFKIDIDAFMSDELSEFEIREKNVFNLSF
jgi:Fe2+ or Zn2+ uptake regulation protein